jgi:hypothetical protein
MLNPSTADHERDDPTIRRCIGFGKTWGFGALAVGNLFALRSPSPATLRTCPDPVGADNEEWLARLIEESPLTIAAWGNHGRLFGRSGRLRRRLQRVHVLGITKSGEPRHPLFVHSSARPIPWLVPID